MRRFGLLFDALPRPPIRSWGASERDPAYVLHFQEHDDALIYTDARKAQEEFVEELIPSCFIYYQWLEREKGVLREHTLCSTICKAVG